MLKVQEFLQDKTHAQLTDELGIKVNSDPEFPNLVSLNYDQLNSPKSHAIVRECRGLIMNKDHEVIGRSFDRFYNHGEMKEVTKHLDFTDASALEKLDGSLLNIYYSFEYKSWLVGTRGTTTARNSFTQSGISYLYLVCVALGIDVQVNQPPEYNQQWLPIEAFNHYMAVINTTLDDHLNRDYTYILELVSPDILIVTKYDSTKLYLLDVRKPDGEYVVDKVECFHSPKPYHIAGPNDIHDVVKSLNKGNGSNLLEGIVIKDNKTSLRVKLKNNAYVKAHKTKGKDISSSDIMDIVCEGEEDEFLLYFPELKEKFDEYIQLRERYLAHLQVIVDTVHVMYINGRTNKEIALGVGGKKFGMIFKAITNNVTDSMQIFESMNPNNRIKELTEFKKSIEFDYPVG